MRVSNPMMSSRVVFNMQRSLGRFLELQTELSSGKRINKASDDPVGTLRDLDYRNELSKISRFQETITDGLSWQQNYDSVLADLKDMMESAKMIAVAMANPQPDDDGRIREAEANEIRSIYNSLIQRANNELSGRSVFSGYRTDGPALAMTANGASYLGDTGLIEYQIESSSRLGVNLLGSDVFFKQITTLGEDADLNVGVVGTTALSDLNGGTGIDLTTGATPGTFTITDRNLGITSTIDLVTSGATSIQDVVTEINTQLAADGITDVTVRVGDGTNLVFETTASGIIANATSLGLLNGRNGVDLSPGHIIVTDDAGINVEVDFSGASNIGDVIATFNAAMAGAGNPALANVTMSINGAGTGLQIVDANGVPLGLRIDDQDSTQTTATDLGIVGNVAPNLVGQDLNPNVSFIIEETTGTTAADLGIRNELFGSFSGSDLDPDVTATATLADLNNANGFELGEIVLWQGDQSRRIDLSDPTILTVQDLMDRFNNCGLDITAQINATNDGIEIINDDTNRTLTIEDGDTGRAAKALGLFGASDMVGTLKVMENALRNNDVEAIRGILDDFDRAIEHLLATRATVGAKAIRLETTDARLQEMDLAFLARLSEVEDADIAELITELATHENAYQASLMATAKIIQPTLINFLK